MLVVLQGIDAAGKDSTVKHVFCGANPQGVRVFTYKEPTPRRPRTTSSGATTPDVPARGMIHVFNRSHYEDVLVVRVKGLIEEARWRSRYDSINDFERMLAREGLVARIVCATLEAMNPYWPMPDADLEAYALDELEDSVSSNR